MDKTMEQLGYRKTETKVYENARLTKNIISYTDEKEIKTIKIDLKQGNIEAQDKRAYALRSASITIEELKALCQEEEVKNFQER